MQYRFIQLMVCGWLLTHCLMSGAATPKFWTNPQLQDQLNAWVSAHPELVRFRSIATSRRANSVWLVELGNETEIDRAKRPAMLLVAGIEGNDQIGTATALAWVEHLLSSPESRSVLEKNTVYVLPRVNPDAAMAYFERPQMERAATYLPHDDDHDGLVDEDGGEDLNNDGLITAMRVQDPDGEYILDPTDPRLLLKADKARGEVGAWRLLTEGRDNDGDEEWNEDGAGGVNLNRNFPYQFKYFAPSAGQHPMSEMETRALADFVVGHSNIGIVFTFGASDNLMKTPEGKEEGGQRPPTSLHKDDVAFYRELGKSWRESLSLKKELTGVTEPGTFSDWIYFHRGRLSLAARTWSPGVQVELDKSGQNPEENPKQSDSDSASKRSESNDKPDPKPKPDSDNRNEEDRAFLKWLDRHAPQAFLPWKEIEHPDFPGKKVEIGGFAPFARTNPPEALLGPLVEKQVKYLTELAGKLPRVGIRSATAKHLGNSVFELKVEIENTGYLPTSLAQGRLTREVLPTRLLLEVPESAILSGARRTNFEGIEGSGGKREARFIVYDKDRGRVRVELVSTLGGTAEAEIELAR